MSWYKKSTIKFINNFENIVLLGNISKLGYLNI